MPKLPPPAKIDVSDRQKNSRWLVQDERQGGHRHKCSRLCILDEKLRFPSGTGVQGVVLWEVRPYRWGRSAPVSMVRGRGRPPGGPQPRSNANRVVGRLRAAEDVRPYRWGRSAPVSIVRGRGRPPGGPQPRSNEIALWGGCGRPRTSAPTGGIEGLWGKDIGPFIRTSSDALLLRCSDAEIGQDRASG